MGGWRNHAAAALLALDGFGAIGFAAALGGALGGLGHGDRRLLHWIALGLAASMLRGLCTWGSVRCGSSASMHVRRVLGRRMMVACLGLPPGLRPTVGEMMVTAIDAVEAIDGYVARFLPARRCAGLVPPLILLAVAFASPICAVIMAATLVPFVLAMVLAGGAAAEESRRQFAALSRLSGLFADRIRSLPVVLAFQDEDRQARLLARSATDLQRRTFEVLRIALVSSAALEFFAAISVALVAVYAGFNLLGLLPFHIPEHLDLGRAVFVLALAPELYATMRRLAAAYHDRQAAQSAVDPMMRIERLARPVDAPRRRVLIPRLLATTRPLRFETAPAIRFDEATVQYPGEEHPALDRLALHIEPGEFVVLLGPSGSGKTTALHLLLGLAPLSAGEVWIDEHPLSELGSIASSVAWVGQSPLIIPASVAENVALSRPDAARSEVEEAVTRVGLCAMLLGSPDGLDRMLDERGGGLSGGERRRIALARALLRPAPVLLLDEPTAHLDEAAALAVIRAIRTVARGRTTLVATHSEALAAVADRVVRLGPPRLDSR